MSSPFRFVPSLLGLSALTLLSACSGVSPIATSSAVPSVAVRGSVHGGQQPVSGATIQLYTVGTSSDSSAAAALGSSTTTASDGSFTLTGHYNCSNAANGVNSLVYLLSTGGNPGSGTNANLAMMAALGPCSGLGTSTFIFIDEVTTIGSIAALAPYMSGPYNLGSGSSDAAAFATAFGNVAKYTNTSTGTAPGPSLPGGYYASSTEINTLGNIIAACINSTGGAAVGSNSSDGSACGNLFNLSRSGGTAPTNTINAVLNIINNPTQNVSGLFNTTQSVTPFQPVDSIAPTTWALPILQMAATPTFSVAGGNYSSAQFVTLSDTTSGAVIHYTTDGTTPTSASPIYSGTLTVFSSSETINAIAQAGGYATSAVASATYAISGSIVTYTVNGQIIIPNCGVASIPGITLTLSHAGVTVQTFTSNANGSYFFSGVPNGTYTLTPSIVGPSSAFYPTTQTVVVNGNNVTPLQFQANLGYTVSGTVAYSGSQTGQIYLTLNPNSCGIGSSELGTSISTTGAYTIHGVPPGSYTVQAWMDPQALGQGVKNAIDPTGSNSLTVANANVTGVAVTLLDPTFATPASNPTIQNIIPNAQGALILFQSSQNSSNVEDANQYTVEWSTSPTLGGGSGGAQFASIAGSKTFAASGDKGLWVLTNASLTSGQTYYFQARSFNTLDTANPHPSGWCNYTSSGCSGTSGFTPVAIAAPTCSGTCTTVTSSVTIPAAITIKPGAPLYLGLLQFSNGTGGDPSAIYLTEITSPTNGANGFTLTVPSGSNFAIMGILDQNNNGGGAGSISNIQNKVQANLTISGGTQSPTGVTLPSSNSTATVSTQFFSSSCLTCGSTSTGYQLTFEVNQSDKQPVAATLNSGPNVPSNNGIVAMDMGICTSCGNPQFGYTIPLSGTPSVGDTYGFTVTYSDGSQDTGTTVTGAVTGWNNGSTVVDATDAPTALAPTNNSSTSTTPTFTWTDSSNALGANLYYSFYLSNGGTCSGSCTIWQIPGNNSKSNGFSNSITSIPWITSGNDVTGTSNNLPSVSALTLGTTYNWQVQVQDSNGNSAQTQVQYQP